MKTGTQWSVWLATQIIFWTMLAWGFFGGSHGAVLVACFFAWVAAILSLCFLSAEFRSEYLDKARAVPPWLVIGLDLAAVIVFVFHGYVVTGAAFLLQVLLYASVIGERDAS